MSTGELLGEKVSLLPLKDFVIADDGHRSWVGRLVGWHPSDGPLAGFVRLDPAYAYIEAWPIASNGSVTRLRAVLPVEQMVSVDQVDLKPTSLVSLGQLDEFDAEFFAGLVRAAEGVRKELRAQRSGLTLATAMPPAQKAH